MNFVSSPSPRLRWLFTALPVSRPRGLPLAGAGRHGRSRISHLANSFSLLTGRMSSTLRSAGAEMTQYSTFFCGWTSSMASHSGDS